MFMGRLYGAKQFCAEIDFTQTFQKATPLESTVS
jgi:hypothetical protein